MESITWSFSFWSSIAHRKHDIFLSFRGDDTRHGLAKDLHSALLKADIPTFIDEEYLEKGREVASDLLKAIQMSRVAIILVSRNYADSSWCLDELVKILECKRIDGQFVLPVFYDVDPDDVRWQSGPFGEAFEERFHEDSENKVEKWREALVESATLSGLYLHNNSEWHESMFIKEIINQVSRRRQDAHITLHLQPSMDYAKDSLNYLLSVVSDDVLVIGIYGKSYVGKTNVATSAYNQNFLRFDGSSFLAKVDEVSEQPNGLVRLQKQLLSDILLVNEDKIEIDDVNMGIDMIRTTLPSKRVLVALEDVEKLDQLNALARRRDWFGSGSRIIITTRDASLLSILESDDVYGKKGIQILKDKYAENLKTIEVLDEVVRKLHSQAETKVRSLVAEIEMARKNNAIQAQFIAELEPSRDLVLSSAVHVYETLLDSEPEKEITNLDEFFHFGDPQGENSLSIENESKGFSRKTSRDEAAECRFSEVIEDEGFR